LPRALIIIPAYKIRIDSREYLVDAFFIDGRLDFPCRRALLIFNTTRKTGSPPQVDRKYVIKNIVKPEKTIELLREALEWTEKMRIELARRTFRRYRLALLVPVFRTPKKLEESIRGEKIPDEWELNGALHILKNIVFPRGTRKSPKIIGQDRVAIAIEHTREKISVIWGSGSIVEKNYSWLLDNDDTFRKTILRILSRERSTS